MKEGLLLTPRPWRIEPGVGTFSLDLSTKIQIESGFSGATLRSAESIQRELVSLFDLDLAIVPVSNPSAGHITLRILGLDNLADSSAERASLATLGAEAYSLVIGDQGVAIIGVDEAGLFYGVQTLIQIVRSSGRCLPALTITDRPAVPNRGFLIDITRGKVHSIEALEKLIRTFAHVKCNHLQLYTEHAFDFPSVPEIGAGSSALTPEEVLRLDRLCQELHIELAPNFQSLGHQGQLLKVPALEHLAETPWRFTFATDNDEVFDFLDGLYADLLPCFQSRLLNVNADEPWDIGRGVSAAMVAERGIGGTYLHHLKQLHVLTDKHGCRMAMWADVLKHYPELMPELPEDILLIDWWYESTERYASLDALSASGREFWICAATSSWLALYPRLENAIANIRDYVQQGVALGANGVLISDWGDNGHDQLLTNSTYPLLWGAECAWTGATTSSETFDAAFGFHFLKDRSGVLVAALRRLGAAMQVERNWMAGWNTAMAFYEDPLVGKVAGVSPESVVREALSAAADLQPLLPQFPDHVMRADLGFLTNQLIFACEKVELTRSIRAFLLEQAGHADSTPAAAARFRELIASFDAQRQRLPALKLEFERRWLASARPSSIQFNLDRYTRLIAQFDRALAWLTGQYDRYAAGEPIDGSLSSYDTGGYAVLHEATYYWVKELEAIIGYDALPSDIKDYLRDTLG